MGVVESPDGHHHVTYTEIESRRETLFEPELLKLHFPALFHFALPFAGFSVFFFDGNARARVFKFDLALHFPAFTEIV